MASQLFTARFQLSLFRGAFTEWNKDRAMRLSAALSYYATFSIAPLIMILVGMVGWFYTEEARSGLIEAQLTSVVGAQAAKAIQSIVESASRNSTSSTLLGFGTLLVAASAIFAQLKDSLDTVWQVQARPGLGLSHLLRDRLLTFGIVLVIGFLLLVSLVAATVLKALAAWLQERFGVPGALQALLFLVSLGVETTLFASIFKLLPSARVQWRDVWVGAFFTGTLFEVGKYALSLYLGSGGPSTAFGAAGSVVLVLVWVYYASCILFFGANLTEVYCRLVGRPIQPAWDAESTEIACVHGRPVPASSVPGGSVPAERSPLQPEAEVPAQPPRESLLPLLREAHRPAPRHPGPRRAPEGVAEQWQARLEGWHAHPVTEVAVALGLGLAAGFLSRLASRREGP